MPIRETKFAPGEYYHLYIRGNNKQPIFTAERDYVRLLFLILFFQSPIKIHNISNRISDFINYQDFNISKKKIEEIIANRMVELVNFSFMTNHIHITAKEETEAGISKYMMRIQDSFTKYTNIKYNRSGHLFQGQFKAVHIEDNNQLLYLSSYIHRNPRELKGWKNKEYLYPWSSYQDYVGKNRWGELLKNDIILEQFKNPQEYKKFVEISIAKE